MIFLLMARAMALACRGHRELVLENIVLRQQLRTLQRAVIRPRLRTRDRVFWVLMANTWRDWRRALVFRPAPAIQSQMVIDGRKSAFPAVRLGVKAQPQDPSMKPHER